MCLSAYRLKLYILWLFIISFDYYLYLFNFYFLQVRRREAGLEAPAGPPTSTAGLGSDRLGDQPNNLKTLGAHWSGITELYPMKFCIRKDVHLRKIV